MWKSHHLLCEGLLCLLLSFSQQAVALGGALEAVLFHDGLHHALVPQLPDALKVLLCQYPPILQKLLWSTTSAQDTFQQHRSLPRHIWVGGMQKCMLKRALVGHASHWEAKHLIAGASGLTWGRAAAAESPLLMSAPCADLAFASVSCLFRLCRLSGSLLCCFRFLCRLAALLSGRSS